jgi:hypothetical protein
MAKDFSKSRQYEKLGARIMAPIYALFQRPVAAVERPREFVGTKSNTRLLDADHRFMSRGLQRLGIDYALCLPSGPNPYRFADEKADRFHTTGNFALEELTLTEHALAPSMLHTARAGFLVYLFPASLDIYFIPLEPTRAYVEANRSRFTTTSVGNPTYLTFCTLVPIAELLAAVPDIRHIHAAWFADWASVGKKREPKSLLPPGFAHQSIQFDDLPTALQAMPARRKASVPSMGCSALLHCMTLRDKQRQSNAGHYTKLGLYNLVQDIVPANRFGFAPFTPLELAQSVGQASPDDGIDPHEPDFEPVLKLLEIS